MARKSSFNSLVRQAAKESARRERERERLERARLKELEKAKRDAQRLKKQQAKEAKQRYIEARIDEVEELNLLLAEQIESLSSILEFTLKVDDTISFNSLRITDSFQPYTIPITLRKPIKKPTLNSFTKKVNQPNRFEKLIPGRTKKYEEELEAARNAFQKAIEKYEQNETNRNELIQKHREDYEVDKQAFEIKAKQKNQEIDDFEEAYFSGDPEAIITYFTMVLERSEYPDEFPQEFRLAYLPEPKELVIEYELPDIQIIPKIGSYRYIKTRDEITKKARQANDIKNLYQDIVAALCLRTIHEVLEAEQANNILVIVFNGFVQTIDPATGNDIRPHLISIRTTKEKFQNIQLDRVEKKACLRNLGAQISPRPDQMIAIKPVVEFNMVDKRFIEQSDILSDLENKPNLMELNPYEFEHLVSNLFEQIGFQTKLTRSSKDGGVDAIAFDPRPILGGKVVVQAKRYKNVVGVSAVRDLYGTMINEGANKGILVTTSHYGPDAYEFSNDKPIELIDGGGLLYLLEEQGVKAKIIFPED